MLLMKWQIVNQSQASRYNGQFQSDYYFRSGSYWDNNWNSTQLKFLIPFKKHRFTDAQVSSFVDNILGTSPIPDRALFCKFHMIIGTN